ncbi:MAG: N-acetylmuramoyl-L-alanine amidase [Oscillibacter sp.]|nr:N-acetylmuramoyl-L-alanine amidase [Oscillibacter sp.]
MRKAFRKSKLLQFVLCACILAASVLGVRALRQRRLQAFSASGLPGAATVVIDAGHGGEDGGAVSPTGIPESGLNLSIAFRVRDLLRLTGCRTSMTRTEDVSIGDNSLATVRARKASDIRRRTELVNATENAVLLSVHQNSLPSSPITHGAQAFWNRREGGETLAKLIQASLNAQINAGNEKRAYPMNDGVYLMKHAQAPGALVECGFLSNAWETALLTETAYQKELAAAIAAGYLRYASGENAE